MVQTPPILSPLSTLPCPRTGESLHLVCARPSPTSMAMREHQLWASGGPGWVGTVRFCVQEESYIWCKHPPFSRPFRHCPVPAQVNHCTSFVRGLRPHLWRCGNISFGHLECQGGSERSGSVCRRSHIYMVQTPPILSPLSTLPCPRTGESLHLVCARPSPTSMAMREHQLWASGGPGWVGTVRFCVQEESYMVQTPPILSPLSTLPCPRTGESLHLVCARPSPTSMAMREHQLWASGVPGWVGTVRFCVQEESYIWCKHPPILSPLSTLPCPRTGESLHLVCARPSPTSMAMREHQLWASGVPGWVGTVRFCVQEESYIYGANTPHSLATLPCPRTGESLHLVCARPSPTSMAMREHQLWASGGPGWVGTVRFCVQEESYNMVQTPPILSPLSTLPCPRTGESLHLVCARPSPTSMAMREHQLWASGGPGWVGTVRFCVQEESYI
jgi:hypothetical protein